MNCLQPILAVADVLIRVSQEMICSLTTPSLNQATRPGGKLDFNRDGRRKVTSRQRYECHCTVR